jgi:hypothetical protein
MWKQIYYHRRGGYQFKEWKSIFTTGGITLVLFVIVSLLYVVVEWLTLLLRIREDPGSNLSPDTGYTDGFLWFSSVPRGRS